jgi:hypothetical protein
VPLPIRRLCIAAAAALAVVLLGAFAQATAVPIHIDIASVLGKMVYGALSLLGCAFLWLAKQGLDTLKRLDAKVTKISHELFGPEGNNGMRSEVRDSTRRLHAHTKVIAILADREGLDFDAEAR